MTILAVLPVFDKLVEISPLGNDPDIRELKYWMVSRHTTAPAAVRSSLPGLRRRGEGLPDLSFVRRLSSGSLSIGGSAETDSRDELI